MTAATAIGRCQSCHAMPKSTAARPIIAPTDRSMPPVTITGVSAIASRPSSTLSRLISKKLPTVAKFGAIAANSATSTASGEQQDELVGPQEALHDAAPAGGPAERRPGAQRVGRDRGEDDDAVQRALPVGA